MKRFAVLPLLLVTGMALAQSFNVDFNLAAGAGAGVPAAGFGGAAGQTGFWNAVGTQTLFTLGELDSAASGVTLTRSGGGTLVNNSSAAIAGDDEKLLEDGFQGSNGVTVTYTFNNLQAGTYALYTYAVDPASATTTTVNVSGSTSRVDQAVGAFLSGPNYFVGSTHGLHVKTVPAGGSLAVTLAPTGSSINLAGMQLVRLSGDRLRIYVNDNAAGMDNGASWANAFTGIQTALTTARYSGGANTEVWVANGFYEPTTTTDRFVSFSVPNKLHFYGGFVGNETSVGQRGLSLCYLSGDIGAATDSDNSYTVLDASLTDAETLIDGFRIHNGYNNDQAVNGGKGGGLLLQGASAVVRNCTFVNNYATQSGGGVYCDFGSPTLIDCLFYNNEAFEGSALTHSDQFPIRMYNCEFITNNAQEGTVHFENSDGLMVNCYLHGNYAGGIGGAVDADGANSQVEMVNCTIAGNNAGQNTGGVWARNGADVAIKNSILWLNRSGLPQTIAAMQAQASGVGSNITITACTVEGAAGSPGLDPLFVDGDGSNNAWGDFDDNCHLLEASPAINLGGNAHMPADLYDLDGDGNTAEQIDVDLDGNPRVSDTVIDRGCFEFQAACDLIGDANEDGDVDLSDLSVTLAHFGAGNGQTRASGDTDGDGDVDLTDLSRVLANFGSVCP
jgi:hypothetical protein